MRQSRARVPIGAFFLIISLRATNSHPQPIAICIDNKLHHKSLPRAIYRSIKMLLRIPRAVQPLRIYIHTFLPNLARKEREQRLALQKVVSVYTRVSKL